MKRASLKEAELRKRKADACDEALEYLRGRTSTDEGLAVQQILQRALQERS